MKTMSAARWLVIATVGAFGLAACDQTPVELPEATSITVAPSSMTLYQGEMSGVSAQVLDQDGQAMRSVEVAWSSSAPAVATVQNGVVQGVAPGAATLFATYGELQGTVEVTVAEDTEEAASVEILASDMELHVQAPNQYLSYRVTDVRGRTDCWGETMPQVTSSDESVVDAWLVGCGTIGINPEFNGTATVTLTVDGVSDSFQVTVVSNQYAAFWSAQPEAGTMEAGATVDYTVRMLDQENQGVGGETIHFSVTRGSLSTTAVTTDADGYATVSWTLPEFLRNQPGPFDAQAAWDEGTIRFATVLPNGTENTDSDVRAIEPGAPSSFSLFRYDFAIDEWVEISGSYTLDTGTDVYVHTESYDEFGNVRPYDELSLELTPEDPTTFTAYFYSYYFQARSTTAQTVTVTVYDTAGDGLDVATDPSTSIDIIWEDPA